MVYFGANANLTNNRGNREKEPVIMTNKKQEFWTDSNGRQMIRRVQDTRFSYDIGNGAEIEPVTSNYYPINTGKVFVMGHTLHPKIGNFQIFTLSSLFSRLKKVSHYVEIKFICNFD